MCSVYCKFTAEITLQMRRIQWMVQMFIASHQLRSDTYITFLYSTWEKSDQFYLKPLLQFRSRTTLIPTHSRLQIILICTPLLISWKNSSSKYFLQLDGYSHLLNFLVYVKNNLINKCTSLLPTALILIDYTTWQRSILFLSLKSEIVTYISILTMCS